MGSNSDSATSQRALDISSAIDRLRSRIDQLGGRGVRILAVTKGFPLSDVRAAMDAGLEDVGENYAQEIVSKYAAVASDSRPRIHYIGRLQSNKVAGLAPYIAMWQTVDRVRLVEEVARRAPGADILIQVNTTNEPDKGGCLPDDVEVLVNRGTSLGLVVRGLMVVGPTSGDRGLTRRAFAEAARLKTDLNLGELSMGMSADLELAIEYGTTMVRIGSAVFGGRPPKG